MIGNIVGDSISGMIITSASVLIKDGIETIKSNNLSIIELTEWDRAYLNINKLIYSLDKKSYSRHRLPTINKSHFELSVDTKYTIKLKDGNSIKVHCYRDSLKQVGYQESRLRLTFTGKDKYVYRKKLLKRAFQLTDKKHIRVLHLGKDNKIYKDIMPHSFNSIILNDTTKSNIINGLTSWKDSKDWYINHELTHKIGVFLYGKAGTGKSTIAKAISTMFNNAPIVTIDPNNVLYSISYITQLRDEIEGTIVVLIEDFDMFFKSREELENVELDIEKKKKKDNDQNAVFQMLDGIFSTDNTIYIATTNYKDRIDSALIRYGRFDIQEELDYFNYNEALQAVELLDYNKETLDSLNIEYPIQPSLLQSKIMEYRAKKERK